MTTPKKSGASRNRTAGHNFERDTVTALRKAGFLHAATSRSSNRARDNQKVDICNLDEFQHGRLPFNVQCKSEAKPVNYSKLLKEIPVVPDCVNVIFHRRTTKVGSRFMVEGEYSILKIQDFLELLTSLNKYKERYGSLD